MPIGHDLGTALYHLGIRLAAPFAPKAKRWLKGREGLWDRLEARHEALRGCLWFHCSSAGEFEQGRPVLEALRAQHPHRPVLVTFFSPSGPAAFKDLPIATHVDHLPPDGHANAERFLDLVRPDLAVFVKYDLWYHHLQGLRRRGVPTFLIAATFRTGQPFFQWYGGTWRTMLGCFTRIITQDQASVDLLKRIGVRHAAVGGDTRFDRVAEIAAQGHGLPLGQAFHRALDAPVLIAGSTWRPDEDLLAEALRTMRRPPRLLVVPHEPDEAVVSRLVDRMPPPAQRWSQLDQALVEERPTDAGHAMPPDEDPLFARTLVVDRMGILARLYQHADIAYVGGGFTTGIHSILEAAAWGKPVIFGPNHRKFPEARNLIDAGGGFEVRDAGDLREVLERLLGDETLRLHASAAARQLVLGGKGACQRVVALIDQAV